MLKLAIISPNKQAYSETFIQAQKELLPFHVLYYYGGKVPQFLENRGALGDVSPIAKAMTLCLRKLKSSKLSLQQDNFLKSLKRERPNAVLAHYGPTADTILPICKSLNLPLIAHFHGFDASRDEVIAKHNRYKQLFNGASRVIAVSQSMRQKLLELGCPREKLFWNPYGPHNDFLNVTPTFESNNFVALGRFTDKKAPYYTILAFAEVLKKHPGSTLTIGGDGALYNMCKNLVRHFGLDSSVFLPGPIGPDRFRELLADSIAFVQHSIIANDGDSEGTPVAVLEASAAGLPVISTIHGGIPDVIKNGETGFLVNEHDVKSMTDSMIRVLEDKKLASNLGRNGRTYIKDRYCMERHIENLTTIVRGAVLDTK